MRRPSKFKKRLQVQHLAWQVNFRLVCLLFHAQSNFRSSSPGRLSRAKLMPQLVVYHLCEVFCGCAAICRAFEENCYKAFRFDFRVNKSHNIHTCSPGTFDLRRRLASCHLAWDTLRPLVVAGFGSTSPHLCNLLKLIVRKQQRFYWTSYLENNCFHFTVTMRKYFSPMGLLTWEASMAGSSSMFTNPAPAHSRMHRRIGHLRERRTIHKIHPMRLKWQMPRKNAKFLDRCVFER